MLRFLFYGLISLFLFSPSAWGCGCIGTPTGQLSELLEKHTLVYGTPTKVEWLGHQTPIPVLSQNYSDYGRGKTTLMNVNVIGNSPQFDLTFLHPAGGSSCGMSPTVGYKRWFLLIKDSFGAYRSNYCINKSLPYGAILDYYHNGVDPLVMNSLQCRQFTRLKEKTPPENWSESLDGLYKCDFWQTDYNSIFQELRQVYISKYLRMSPVKKTEP